MATFTSLSTFSATADCAWPTSGTSKLAQIRSVVLAIAHLAGAGTACGILLWEHVAVVTRAETSPSQTVAPAEPAGAPTHRGRDLRIDFLRGLCVIGMIVDHVAGPSWLYAITGGNHFYTSAAEGFVFVSGLVAGRAYTRFIDRQGLAYGLS